MVGSWKCHFELKKTFYSWKWCFQLQDVVETIVENHGFFPRWYPSWFLPCMFLIKVSHSKASCFGVSKWRLFVCQSTRRLYKVSKNNPMMTIFHINEMTLKTTLLMWKPMLTFNSLVSCAIGPNERLWPSMTQSTPMCYFPLEPTCIVAPIFC